ncbi:MAG TPA: hypothetical protein VLG50_06875 [Candidatus Saccharimonadales bacterium]|nr:hypothetical protein [Candidatus Saccharimonadales bacterium]
MNYKLILMLACLTQSSSYLISSETVDDSRQLQNDRILLSNHAARVARGVGRSDPRIYGIKRSEDNADNEKSQHYLECVSSILNQTTEGCIYTIVLNHIRRITVLLEEDRDHPIIIETFPATTVPYKSYTIESIFDDPTVSDYDINPQFISAMVLQMPFVFEELKQEADSILQCMTTGRITFNRTQNPPLQLNGVPLARPIYPTTMPNNHNHLHTT